MAEQEAPTNAPASAASALYVVIVTGDRVVYDGMAERVSAPAPQGMVTILPRHAPMLVMLEPGELIVRLGADEENYAVGGGFLEVADDRVTVLGDTVERADEIDVLRAEAARQRARALVAHYQDRPEYAAGMQALRRSRARLKVAQRARRRHGTGSG